jgi:hypothetical protein
MSEKTHTFTTEELSTYAAEQRALGMTWCIDYVRKSGLPWSLRITDRLERFKESVR